MKPICLLLIAAFVVFPPAGDAVKDAKAKLKGSWTSTEIVKGGDKSDMTVALKFDGDHVKVTVGGEDPVTGDYVVDPSKSPATLDVSLEHDGNKITVQALYEVKGDVLRICHAIDLSGARPDAIAARADTALVTLKREK